MQTSQVRQQPAVLLAIEDAALVGELRRSLDGLGCQCRQVAQLGELSTALAERRWALFIVTTSCHGRSGLDVCREYREQLSGIPVAFVANTGCLESALDAMRSGALDVVTRPIRTSQLEQLVARICHHSQHTAQGKAEQSDEVGDDFAAHNGTSLPDNGAQRGAAAARPLRATDAVAGVAPRHRDHHVASGNGTTVNVTEHTTDEMVSFESEAIVLRQLEATLVGVSPEIIQLRRLVAQAAPTEAAVMIHGESGTGKELVAKEVHRLSRRADSPFVSVNMAAIPQGMAEVELFGRDVDTAPDSANGQGGYCRAAHRGTLYLHDIGEMEMCVQPKLLRFLQEGTVHPAGPRVETVVDTRIITATCRPPRAIVRDGSIREDLYFRLNVVPIYIPPLRDRREDIEVLAETFLRKAAERNQKPVVGFAENAISVLRAYDWPGNARQLENTVESLVVLARRRVIDAADIPNEYHVGADVIGNGYQQDDECRSVAPAVDGEGGQLTLIQRHERAAIVDALRRVDGNVVDAAKQLGLGQATVYRKIKLYDIRRERRRRQSKPR